MTQILDTKRLSLMQWLRNMQLKWKVAALGVLMAGLLTVEGGLALAPEPSHFLTLVVLGAGYLVGGGLTFVIVRRLADGLKKLNGRLDACSVATQEHLKPALQALADGDLTVELHAATTAVSISADDELGEMMRHIEVFRSAVIDCYDAYNNATQRLREVMGTVTSTAGSVTAASQEMSSTSEEAGKATGEIAQAISGVAEGAERQAKMAEEATRSAEEITRAVAESAENAARTAEVATNAHRAAEQGVGAAEKASHAMESVRDSSNEVTETIRALAEKSEQIGQIVQTITGIAEQTNLLALNAAIEAARAGEQGRGFAVVAEEVRKLAEDSQHAAEEISELIGAMQSETSRAVTVVEDGAKRTQDGVAVVEETREAFLSIGQAVQDMDTRIAQIAAAAEQITASATSMQQNVSEVAAVAQESSASTEEVSASTEQTSASAQQIAASAEELANNAEALNEMVARFKVTS